MGRVLFFGTLVIAIGLEGLLLNTTLPEKILRPEEMYRGHLNVFRSAVIVRWSAAVYIAQKNLPSPRTVARL
jgi:hypothetical protein